MKHPVVTAIVSCTLLMAMAAVALPSGMFGGTTPHPAVVRIMALEEDGTSFGSGTLVAVTESHGLIVTNWHVVRDASGPITVFFPDGFHSGATVLRVDRDWDLAALAIWRPRVMPVVVSNTAPQPGEPLTIAGYGRGDYRTVAGRCTKYVSPGGSQPSEMVELEASARNGDSGGPIFNSRGELAGVLFGTAFGRTMGSYCGRLRWFLNSVTNDFQRMPTPDMLARQQPSPVVPAQFQTQVSPQTGPQPQTPSPTIASAAAAPVEYANPAMPSANAMPQGTPPSNASPSVAAAPAPGTPASASPSGETSARPASAVNASINASPAPGAAKAAASDSAVAAVPSPPTSNFPKTDQLKTIFAAIGVLAVLYQAIRLLGSAVG